MGSKNHNKKRSKHCENCGMPKDYNYYRSIMDGIYLCNDCADLPISKIRKRGDSVKWVLVDGEYYPKDYPIVKRKK